MLIDTTSDQDHISRSATDEVSDGKRSDSHMFLRKEVRASCRRGPEHKLYHAPRALADLPANEIMAFPSPSQTTVTDLGRRIQIEDVPYDAPVFNSILSLDRDPSFLYTCTCAVCKENDVSGFTLVHCHTRLGTETRVLDSNRTLHPVSLIRSCAGHACLPDWTSGHAL